MLIADVNNLNDAEPFEGAIYLPRSLMAQARRGFRGSRGNSEDTFCSSA